MAKDNQPMTETRTENGETVASSSIQQHTITVQAVDKDECEEKKKELKWAEDVVDNENMGKKKSKGMKDKDLFSVCCIFKRDEDDSELESSGEDSESEPNAYEKLPKRCNKHK